MWSGADRAPLVWGGASGAGMSSIPGRDGGSSEDIGEIEAGAMLQRQPGLGPRGVRRLLDRWGTARAVSSRSPLELARILERDPASIEAARRKVDRRAVRRRIDRARRRGVRFLSWSCPRYPALWRGMSDPPAQVGVLGRIECLSSRPVVAVVGSRRAGAVAIDQAVRFASAFAEAGWTVCSGGARGVDAAAHRACLRLGGATIAVVGSGLGVPYPPEHDELFREIAESGGAVVSEHEFDAPPHARHFPVRNRLVAGLSVGVLVVEAGPRSGALITARLAAEDYGREALVVPGRVDTGRNAGGHRAIREGWATLVDAPDQALELLESQGGLCRLVETRGEGDLDFN